MIEIVPGVFQLSLRGPLFANVFLIDAGDALVLVDAGMRGDIRAILKSAGQLGWPGRPLRAIVLTHADLDHMGAAPRLVQMTGACVAAHRDEMPLVAARGWRPMSHWGPVGRLIGPLYGPGMRALLPKAPMAVDWPVEDADEVPGGFRVVHTPGHTPGHIALYHPEKHVLLVGDALSNLVRLGGPTGMFTSDMARARQSVRKLAPLDMDVVGFGHGPPLRHDAARQIRKLAQSLA